MGTLSKKLREAPPRFFVFSDAAASGKKRWRGRPQENDGRGQEWQVEAEVMLGPLEIFCMIGPVRMQVRRSELGAGYELSSKRIRNCACAALAVSVLIVVVIGCSGGSPPKPVPNAITNNPKT